MSSPRLLWIDFLRGLAVLGMIEAHSVNSFLDPVYRSGEWFMLFNYVNGWVAPTFLFIAGLLQGAALRRNWENPRPPAARYRSLGIILLIGYGLQFPWGALLHFSQGGAAEIYRSLGKIDVLHCLAVSLALLLALANFCKKVRQYDIVVLFLAGGIVLAAPMIWQALAGTTSYNPLLGYISPIRGALFPVVPWFGFVAAGTLCSRWILSPPVLGGLCLGTATVGWLLNLFFHTWLWPQTYVTRYDAFFFRLSLVLFGCALCSLVFQRWTTPGIIRKWILWCGTHSLGLYVWHLVLLHSGLGFIPALRSVFPKTQLPGTVFWLYLLTLSGTIFLIWLWQWMRKNFWRRTKV